ncbi:MAG: glycerate kinase [Rhodospirillales bacterium]|nr:glycerate kinase [Rhodospirillales bacterium]
MRNQLQALMTAALKAADPLRVIPAFLPPPPLGRTVVVAAGKAAASMAVAVEKFWKSKLTGLAVTRYGHAQPTRGIEIVEAAHPVPDAAGRQAAARLLASVRGLTLNDLVLVLLSGGASALLALPAEGGTLDDKRRITQALLRSGATIAEINCVRKHLSAIKGGRLAAAAFPAQVRTLAISDVPGDDPAVIGSGPTVADPTTIADAQAVLARYAIDPPPAWSESVKPGDPRLAKAVYTLIARPADALAAAAVAAKGMGFKPQILGDAIQGEARMVAADQAKLALAAPPGTVLLSGGETTVTVRGSGKGGRNGEFLLALAIALEGRAGIWALAVDTDGIDGFGDNAGAIVTPDTLARARALGLDPTAFLATNDSYTFFSTLGDLVVTGPTGTNVTDFRAILVSPS